MTIVKRIARFAAYQRTVSQLNRLNDRQLEDLGIARGEIKSLARAKAF